jgi:hypothetical protein
MGGAFVAVADDATATYWNPAGLAPGAYFSATLDHPKVETIDGRNRPLEPATRAMRTGGTFLSVAFPAVGLSYHGFDIIQLRSTDQSTAKSSESRQDLGSILPTLSALHASEFGVTLLHSLTAEVTVGTTVKLIHGEAIVDRATPVAPPAEVLDRSAGLSGRSATTFDLDVGAMAILGSIKVGLVARNVRQPHFQSFDPSVEPVRLPRQVRAGVARSTGGFVLAVDADLTRCGAPTGDRRVIAIGAERWLLSRRVGVRGGFRANTIDRPRPVGTGGLSVAARPGVFADVQVTRGHGDADRGWGIAATVTF